MKCNVCVDPTLMLNNKLLFSDLAVVEWTQNEITWKAKDIVQNEIKIMPSYTPCFLFYSISQNPFRIHLNGCEKQRNHSIVWGV